MKSVLKAVRLESKLYVWGSNSQEFCRFYGVVFESLYHIYFHFYFPFSFIIFFKRWQQSIFMMTVLIASIPNCGKGYTKTLMRAPPTTL